MNPGLDAPRARGRLLLGLGVSVELLGTAVLVGQEQDVYTINSSVTLPAWGAMIVGIVLVALGYSQLLRSTPARSAFALAVAGAAAGAVLLGASLAWQLAYGLISSGDLDLEVYAALALFFLGVATLTTALGALGRSGSAADGVRAADSRTGARPRILRFGGATAALAAGAAFLGASGATAGWLNAQAADVNSLYQFVAVELAWGGAWLSLFGASNLLGRLEPVRRPSARQFAALAGLGVLVAGAAVWGWASPFVYALGEILLGGFLMAGVGLLILVRRADDGSRSVARPPSNPIPPG